MGIRIYSAQVGLLVLLLTVLPAAKSIWLSVPEKEIKCVSEDLRTNVVSLADYYVVPGEEDTAYTTPGISIKVTSPYGNTIHHQENVTDGQFSFSTSEDGSYLACFNVFGEQARKTVTVGIDWKTGIAAKDWESVAKKEKIEGLELELSKLEGVVEAIRDNLVYLKKREAEMREVSEKTNGRVAWFSIMSIGICVLISLLQVGYLKQYFLKKKLI